MDLLPEYNNFILSTMEDFSRICLSIFYFGNIEDTVVGENDIWGECCKKGPDQIENFIKNFFTSEIDVNSII